MPPRRVLPRHPQHQQAYGCRCRRPARTSTFRVIPLAPPACDASSTALPASRRTPAPTGGGATGGSTPPARSDPPAYTEDAELAGAEPGLRPQHQQLNVFRALAAEAQPQHRDHPADKPVHDAESHPHIIPDGRTPGPQTTSSGAHSDSEAAQARGTAAFGMRSGACRLIHRFPLQTRVARPREPAVRVSG